jgi:hypothetical protein
MAASELDVFRQRGDGVMGFRSGMTPEGCKRSAVSVKSIAKHSDVGLTIELGPTAPLVVCQLAPCGFEHLR